jgi:hypothetical protein
MNKPRIFISHVSEESDFANKLKEWIDEILLSAVEIFVSSDKGVSIPLGADWPQKIKESLELADIMLVLISHNSKNRKWIFFETGAGYVRGIPVIPICIGGISKIDLPVPLNLLQAIKIPDDSEERQLINIIAKIAGLKSPKKFTRKLALPLKQILDIPQESNLKIDAVDFYESILESETKLILVDYFINISDLNKDLTLTEIERLLHLKEKNRRKYVHKSLEDLQKAGYINKKREKNKTTWQVSKSGRLFFNNLEKEKGLCLRPVLRPEGDDTA